MSSNMMFNIPLFLHFVDILYGRSMHMISVQAKFERENVGATPIKTQTMELCNKSKVNHGASRRNYCYCLKDTIQIKAPI